MIVCFQQVHFRSESGISVLALFQKHPPDTHQSNASTPHWDLWGTIEWIRISAYCVEVADKSNDCEHQPRQQSPTHVIPSHLPVGMPYFPIRSK